MVLYTAHKHACNQIISSLLILVSLMFTTPLSWGSNEGKIQYGSWGFTNIRHLEMNSRFEIGTHKCSLFSCVQSADGRSDYATIPTPPPKSRGLKTLLFGEKFQCDFCKHIMPEKDASRHALLHDKQSHHGNPKTDSTAVTLLKKVAMPTSCACGYSYIDQSSASNMTQSQRIKVHQRVRNKCSYCEKEVPCVEKNQHESFCYQRKLKCPSCPQEKEDMSIEQLVTHFSAMNMDPEHRTIQCGVCKIQIPALEFERHVGLIHNPNAHLARHTLADCPWCEGYTATDLYSDAELIAHAAENHSSQFIKLTTVQTLADSDISSRTQKNLWEIIQSYQQRADYQQTLQIDKKSEAQYLKLKAQEHIPGTPYLWRIPQITKELQLAKKQPSHTLQSASFLTHPNGYKIALVLFPNGEGKAEGSHLSLHIKIQNSGHDSLLPWPFKPIVKLTMKSQNPHSPSKKIALKFKPDPNLASSQRPVNTENVATGFSHFVDQSIYDNPTYVQDDTMFIECAVDTRGLPYAYQPQTYLYNN